MRILVAEDDSRLLMQLDSLFQQQGFSIDLADDGEKALFQLKEVNYDLAVIDIGLPKLDGFDVIRQARSSDVSTPVLILTARDRWQEKVEGLDAGADDYLTKPFDLEELQVRVKALLRRSDRAPVGTSNHNEILSYGPLTLVPERFEAIWFDQPVRLTHLEFELLHCLLQRHGQTVAPSLILKEVWGYEPDDDIETIRVHVRHLRPKREPDPRKPRFIKTVYGAGYCLELPTSAQMDGLEDVVAMAREERKQQGDRASA
mgnify:CR=1 FL=1